MRNVHRSLHVSGNHCLVGADTSSSAPGLTQKQKSATSYDVVSVSSFLKPLLRQPYSVHDQPADRCRVPYHLPNPQMWQPPAGQVSPEVSAMARQTHSGQRQLFTTSCLAALSRILLQQRLQHTSLHPPTHPSLPLPAAAKQEPQNPVKQLRIPVQGP